ncbi:MAG TPA: hypothetical protein IAA53_08045 [Candidatus Avoscillospira avicola]|uniref:Glycosyl hydrolase family 95 catalytic domain-containing protein n=1 Tax=Candidatus Avoscillospira avicola TaxID=2840706 RepID=A0A9D1DII3_9FIRM|nr:hypothetical protein [Candidatus Avoscillospira avicola]
MKHQIAFHNAPSDWFEALPLGNGSYGAMAWYRDRCLTISLNHYAVYYLHGMPLTHTQRGVYEPIAAYEQRMRENERDYRQEPFRNYRKSLWPAADVVREAGTGHLGTSHPHSGQIELYFSEALDDADNTCLRLDIEQALLTLTIRKGQKRLTVTARVLQGTDVLLLEAEQTEKLLERAVVRYPLRRGHEGYVCRYSTLGSGTAAVQTSFPTPDGGRQELAAVLTGQGAELHPASGDRWAALELTEAPVRISFAVSVQLLREMGAAEAAEQNRRVLETADSWKAAHAAHWEDFFSRSRVFLPDLFLERLWYYNQYILACCSGRKGPHPEQACGLNGLWDVRQPTIWGSMWYWDINIQAAFWGVFSSNHLELAEAFCDGFLAYVPMAEQRAEDFYHTTGYAIDYPHEFYNCIGPWCAQFLWWYYERTGDLDFLRNKAYPVFQKQIEFIRNIAKWDEARQCWYIYPDIAPEQGPVARNSTITLAVIRYLLLFTLRAGRILGEDREVLCGYAKFLKELPPYPTAQAEVYGTILRDSETAPAILELRHPSLLMPIYPAGLIDASAPDALRALGENTVRFAQNHTELGVFPFGWIAAAAARMGMGNTAIRVLYEQGLDCILRANGMGAEETDRFINHCILEFGYNYPPFMMEPVGEIPAVVNEMLLQSRKGAIHVFPAIPDGSGDRRGDAYTMEPLTKLREDCFPDWRDCAFENLMTDRGFLVSAARREGRVRYVKLRSTLGGKALLCLPEGWETCAATCEGVPTSCRIANGYCVLDTAAGSEYLLCPDSAAEAGAAEPAEDRGAQAPISYISHTGRRVFAGKDELTEIVKALDDGLFDRYVDNVRGHKIAPYCFSFGVPNGERKPIAEVRYAPADQSEKRFLKITAESAFRTAVGYGFAAQGTLAAQDGGRTNCLLQDCLCGTDPAAFDVDLPDGRYTLLLVCGGADQATETTVSCGGVTASAAAKPGCYGLLRMTVSHRGPEPLRLSITAGGQPWCVNLLLIQKDAAYL